MRARVCVLAMGLLVWSLPASSAGADFYDEAVLRTLQLNFAQANWQTLLRNNKASKTNIPATLTVDGVVYEGVGVRYRGNTSYQASRDKNSFNIDIDWTVEGQELMGYDSLNLINCTNDPTFMREVLYTNICRQHTPSAKANFVRLEINGVNWGVYANVQQLDGEFIREWFASSQGTRWRGDGMQNMGGMGGGGGTAPPGGGGTTPPVNPRVQTGLPVVVNEIGGGGVPGRTSGQAALTWLGTDTAAYQAVYELKQTYQADPWAGLINTCNVLNNASLAQLPDVIEDVLNVDRALWLCAFEILFQDDDGYVFKWGSDYGLYYEPETGRIHLIQYDGNESMNTTTASVFEGTSYAKVPIMNRLVGNIPQYRQRYLAHVRTILDLYLTEEYFAAKIDAYQALIDQEVQNDTKKLYSYSAFTSGVAALKQFPQKRRAALFPRPSTRSVVFALTAQQELAQSISTAPQILAVDCETALSDAGEALTVTATVAATPAVSGVELVVAPGPFALFTPVAMTEVGQGDAESRVFAVTLPTYASGTVLRYYVQATADTAARTVTLCPPGAEHHVYTHIVTAPQAASSVIVINEVMASNHVTLADPQGEFNDWIEIKNVSDQPVDLAGMYLSDNPQDPLKWAFPAETWIEAGGYVLVWADEDGDDTPGLHANFKLSATGETLWLLDTAANRHALLDSVSFGPLEMDQSMGRYPDGEGPMQVLSAPSPLTENLEPEP